jgi:hypothetical protein
MPEWLGIVVFLIPLLALLIYGVLRLSGRVREPPGLPPGRRGGASRIGHSGVPLSDAPYYARKLNEEAEQEKQP